jgi:hypothetical protein
MHLDCQNILCDNKVWPECPHSNILEEFECEIGQTVWVLDFSENMGSYIVVSGEICGYEEHSGVVFLRILLNTSVDAILIVRASLIGSTVFYSESEAYEMREIAIRNMK